MNAGYTPLLVRIARRLTTYGVELEADIDLGSAFNLRTALTLQDSQSEDFAIWVFNGLGPQDDTITRVPDSDADNAAKVMATTTLTYKPVDRLSSFLTWRHMGKRAANRYNAFDLPAFDEVDLGATLHITESLTVGANINNVFNEEGVLSFAPSGALPVGARPASANACAGAGESQPGVQYSSQSAPVLLPHSGLQVLSDHA